MGLGNHRAMVDDPTSTAKNSDSDLSDAAAPKPGATAEPKTSERPTYTTAADLDGLATDRSILKSDGGRVGIASDADDDHLRPVEFAVYILRWLALALSVIVLTFSSEGFETEHIVALIAIGSYTCFRTLFPFPIPPPRKGLTRVSSFLDLALHLGAVVTTGLWDSAMIYPLAMSIVVLSLTFGRLFGAIATALTAGTLTIFALTSGDAVTGNLSQRGMEGTAVLAIGAVLGGLVHQTTVSSKQSNLIDEQAFTKLTDTNRLLTDLHQVTQSLPNSFDHHEVLRSSMADLRNLLNFDSAAVLMYDQLGKQWLVAHQEGLPVDSCIDEGNLPPLALLAAREQRIVQASNDKARSKRFFTNSDSAIFAPLVVNQQLLGLLSIESQDRDAFDQTDRRIVESHVELLGLAIDNARWFDRIRQKGADDERTRIARALHDDMGQSLAYLGFELDRVIRNYAEGDPVDSQLDMLRSDIRVAVGEVRETLYDLRTDVDERKDLVETIQEFALRIADRTGLEVNFSPNAESRLPIPQEREMWKIAQEALINIERHADASRVDIFWTCNDGIAALEIVDDGRGLPAEKSGQFDSYGILGMRERATSMGALLAFVSQPNQGTRVRCILNRN